MERLGPMFPLILGWIIAGSVGPRPGHSSAAAVIAYFSTAGLVSLCWLYRICRMGVRFDQRGVTFRGLLRKQRWTWPEVSHFSDGETTVSDQGGSSRVWALEMVLDDGRKFAVPGTTRMPWSGKSKQPMGLPRPLRKVQQVTERYQIPAQLSGRLFSPVPQIPAEQDGPAGC
jgi:hypothetical protein